MKIFRSTTYVDENYRDQPWYQLEVINQWDWKSKAICCDYIGNNCIYYCLKRNTKTSEKSYKAEVINKLTDNMIQELTKMGYTIINP